MIFAHFIQFFKKKGCEKFMKGYRISIIRHGRTEANDNGVYIGSTDLPLSAKGAGELAAKTDEFDYPAVHRVYSSPLKRCTETAEILFPDTELVISEGFRELDLGDFEEKALTNSLTATTTRHGSKAVGILVRQTAKALKK